MNNNTYSDQSTSGGSKRFCGSVYRRPTVESEAADASRSEPVVQTSSTTPRKRRSSSDREATRQALEERFKAELSQKSDITLKSIEGAPYSESYVDMTKRRIAREILRRRADDM